MGNRVPVKCDEQPQNEQPTLAANNIYDEILAQPSKYNTQNNNNDDAESVHSVFSQYSTGRETSNMLCNLFETFNTSNPSTTSPPIITMQPKPHHPHVTDDSKSVNLMPALPSQPKQQNTNIGGYNPFANFKGYDANINSTNNSNSNNQHNNQYANNNQYNNNNSNSNSNSTNSSTTITWNPNVNTNIWNSFNSTSTTSLNNNNNNNNENINNNENGYHQNNTSTAWNGNNINNNNNNNNINRNINSRKRGRDLVQYDQNNEHEHKKRKIDDNISSLALELASKMAPQTNNRYDIKDTSAPSFYATGAYATGAFATGSVQNNNGKIFHIHGQDGAFIRKLINGDFDDDYDDIDVEIELNSFGNVIGNPYPKILCVPCKACKQWANPSGGRLNEIKIKNHGLIHDKNGGDFEVVFEGKSYFMPSGYTNNLNPAYTLKRETINEKIKKLKAKKAKTKKSKAKVN